MKNESLSNIRKSKGFSAFKMASVIGVSKSYYEKIESGDRSPSFNFMVKFKKAFPEYNTDSIFLNKSKHVM